MPTFTNSATLSYSGGTANSNTVTGELLETVSAAKTAVTDSYSANDDVTFVISLVNSDTSAAAGLTITDDLGGYPFGTETVYPLAYKDGSARCYVNGVLQPTPVVTAGPPLTFSGISIPAGGNAELIYEAAVNAYAPLSPDASITNTATVTGARITLPVTVSETIAPDSRAELSITKAVSPAAVAPGGQLTYTFTIENVGSAAADNTDNAVLTDTFDPVLADLSAVFEGTPWTSGTQYSYSGGVFTSLPGQITVPAASYAQNADGTWTVTPGTAVLTVTGTVVPPTNVSAG